MPKIAYTTTEQMLALNSIILSLQHVMSLTNRDIPVPSARVMPVPCTSPCAEKMLFPRVSSSCWASQSQWDLHGGSVTILQ